MLNRRKLTEKCRFQKSTRKYQVDEDILRGLIVNELSTSRSSMGYTNGQKSQNKSTGSKVCNLVFVIFRKYQA